MTALTVDLSDFALWRNGFPDEIFTELRRTRPLFRHGVTPGVAKTVKRDFWMTTKHRHAVRLHRDAESFTAGEDGEQFRLAANELEFFFFVLAFAGSDTTKNALAIGLQALVANPEQIERYRDEEAVRSSAVEEVLRWASPVAYWTRTTKVDIDMDGQHIPKGERVVSMLRSANRDEEVFESPFTFDIARQPNPHVAFGGGGAHHCLGAMLARAEIRAVLDELLLRADGITLGPAQVTYPDLTTNMSIYDAMAISLTAR
jgi:cytochrome P450